MIAAITIHPGVRAEREREAHQDHQRRADQQHPAPPERVGVGREPQAHRRVAQHRHGQDQADGARIEADGGEVQHQHHRQPPEREQSQRPRREQQPGVAMVHRAAWGSWVGGRASARCGAHPGQGWDDVPLMRIVSLLPAATEIVYALGLGEELVGRSHACDWPPEALDVPGDDRPGGRTRHAGSARARGRGAGPDPDPGAVRGLRADHARGARGGPRARRARWRS